MFQCCIFCIYPSVKSETSDVWIFGVYINNFISSPMKEGLLDISFDIENMDNFGGPFVFFWTFCVKRQQFVCYNVYNSQFCCYYNLQSSFVIRIVIETGLASLWCYNSEWMLTLSIWNLYWLSSNYNNIELKESQ